MTKKTSRPLNTIELAETFLENALGLDIQSDEDYDIIYKIVSAELNIENFDESLITKSSKSYRTRKYRTDSTRIELYKKIVSELLTTPRLTNDDEIVLGNGGAFPLSKVGTDSNAYIIIGLPASGKSGIANNIADQLAAIILDSDYAKRKLPEFANLPFGATLVHEESDYIV